MIDRHWSDQVAFLRCLRDAVLSLSLMVDPNPFSPGPDPLAEFYRRAGEAFDGLPARVDTDVVAAFERVTVTDHGVDWQREGLAGPSSTWTYLVNEPTPGARGLRARVDSPSPGTFGSVILAPLVTILRLAQRWRRSRAA